MKNAKTTNQILANIRDNGGFDNLNKWNTKEVAEYIQSNFNCSMYVAKKVAKELI